MNKFINETLVIYISKFTNTKVIKALKDGMMFSLPFLMIGSLFLLIANLPIEAVSKVISESGIGDVCSQVYSSTFSIVISLSIHPRLWRTLAFTRVLLLVFPDFVVMMTTPLLAREP